MSGVFNFADDEYYFQPNDEDISFLLKDSFFNKLNARYFGGSQQVRDVIREHSRVREYEKGDVIMLKGELSTTLFATIDGNVNLVIEPQESKSYFEDLYLENKDINKKKKLSYLFLFRLLFLRKRVQEWRNVKDKKFTKKEKPVLKIKKVDDFENDTNIKLVPIEKGNILGEIAALTLSARTATIVAAEKVRTIEMRWQGLRYLIGRDVKFSMAINRLYRERVLTYNVRDHFLFQGIPDEDIEKIIDVVIYENLGSIAGDINATIEENIIVQQGDYVDHLIVMLVGTARVAKKRDQDLVTIDYLLPGDAYGLEELFRLWSGGEANYQYAIFAIGQVDVLRIPTHILAPYKGLIAQNYQDSFNSNKTTYFNNNDLCTFILDYHLEIGTQTMFIDSNKCVGCDQCVKACAISHDNSPRFSRTGPSFENLMMVNACMHCLYPSCMMQCPTGAIGRNNETGVVAIDEEACIGCGNCAESCHYNSIRITEIRDKKNELIYYESMDEVVKKATKCDLCESIEGGPQCVRACPYDAISKINMNDKKSIKNILS